MSNRKLTKTQKRQNQQLYKRIRKAYNEVKDKNEDVTYKQFKNRVLAQKEANPDLSWKQVIKKEQRTETFLSAAERSRQNLIKSLKEDFSEEYKEIKNLSRDERGKFKALELEWIKHGNKSGYSFIGLHGLRYFIDVTNSPKEVLVYAI